MQWSSDRSQISGLAMALFVIFAGAGLVLRSVTGSRALLIAGLLVGAYLLFSIKVADQWEKVAVLRLGRYIGLRGPGWFHVIPIIDMLSRRVDQRVRTANVTAESTLTRDTVPVNVDAIVFWMVWNAEKSILEVQDFAQAIMMSAQTALRESIGRHELAQMITERETMGRELQRILDEKTNSWGITVQSVEIRDVRIPQALEDAMSRQAQAERERQARIILGQAETEIADKFAQAAVTYQRQSSGAASARDEHAVRSDQGARVDGDRAVVGSGDDGAGWKSRDRGVGERTGLTGRMPVSNQELR